MAAPSAAPSRHSARAFAVGLVALLALLLAGWLLPRLRRPAPSPPEDALTPLPLSRSPYRNTDPSVSYVGSTACFDCHPGEHWTYRRTGMSRSTAAVEPDREPPDAIVDHPLSGRRLRVYREQGQLRHQ
jgi:hypothetical protein